MMDERLKKEIETHHYAQSTIKKNDDFDASNQDMAPYTSDQNNNDEPIGFFRSQRSVAMRIKDNYENQVNTLEQDKLTLIQRLNDSLVHLDKLNQEKVDQSNQLIEQIKFVRDMQREVQKCEDLTGVVNETLKMDLKKEKELNFQLKEELKRIDMERIRIMQMLNELQGETEDQEIDSHDMTINLKTKSSHIQHLDDDYRDSLLKIDCFQKDVDRIRIEILESQEHMVVLKDRIKQELRDRGDNIEKIKELEDRYINVVTMLQRERQEIDFVQCRHLRLLSTKILFESLESIFYQNMKFSLNVINDSVTMEKRCSQGLIQMRRMLKMNRTQKLKKYFHKWYRDLLKPHKNLKQGALVTSVISKNNSLMNCFYQWHNRYTQKQSQKLKMHQVMQSMLKSKDEYHNRVLKYAIIRWKHNIVDQESNKKLLLSKILKKHNKSLNQSFHKWRSFSLNLEYQIKMNFLGQRVAYMKYMSVLFSTWKAGVQQVKVKKLNRLLRTWKTIKAHTMQRKQFKAQTASILREEKLRKENIMKVCFDEMRIHKETEKYTKVTFQLQEVEIPHIQQANQMIDVAQKDDSQKLKAQGVRAMAKCYGKYLYKYLNQWKNSTDQYHDRLHHEFKMRVLKAYQAKIRNAFSQWIAYKGLRLNDNQAQVIEIYQEESKELTNEIAQERLLIQEKVQRQQCQSGKQTKKILERVTSRLLKQKFHQWRRNIEVKSNKHSIIEGLVKLIEKRQKKLNFDKYLSKTREIKQNFNYDKRVQEIRFKLREKMRRRIFNAIKGFSNNHRSAKHYMRRLISRLDHGMKQNSFKKWLKIRQMKDEKQLIKMQNQVVAQIKSKVGEHGHQSDNVEGVKQQNLKMQNQMKKQAERVIQKWFVKCHGESQKYCFDKWKQLLTSQISKEDKLKRAILHVNRFNTDYMMRAWKNWMSKQKQTVLENEIVYEQKIIDSAQVSIKNNKKIYDMSSDQQSRELTQLNSKKEYLAKINQNCLSALFSRVDSKVHMKKQRYILQQWHSFTMARKRSLLLLGKAISKLTWHIGFNEIQRFSLESASQQNQYKNIKKLIRVYLRRQQRLSISQWRSNCYKSVVSTTKRVSMTIGQLNQEREKLIAISDDRIMRQTINHRKHLQLFGCFEAWRREILEGKSFKERISSFQEQRTYERKRQTLVKWGLRNETTKKVRRAFNFTQRSSKGLNTYSIFIAWKEVFSKQKRLINSLSNLATKVDHYFLALSIFKLKSEANITTVSYNKKRAKGTRIAYKFLNYFTTKKTYEAFNKFRYNLILAKQQERSKKHILTYWMTLKTRTYFKNWRKEASTREVVRYCKEEGPVKIETSKLRQEFLNLQYALRDDGYTQKEVEGIVKELNVKEYGKMNKAVCRMKHFNDDKFVIPWCFDRWREWLNMRKLYRYHLNILNKKSSYQYQDIAHAFNKWKNYDTSRKKDLIQKQKRYLQSECIKQAEEMENCAKKIDDGEQTIEELTSQRDMLLKSYVGSQRLALSVSNASYDRVKLKAFSRLIQTVQGENQQVIEESLKENLDLIARLKERIRAFERSNSQVADQNEELRMGAMDGIYMARSVEELTNEREKLSIDLADKTITIRKLLEDNNNLSTRLSNAQEEAHNLIRVSQMKLQHQGGGEYGSYSGDHGMLNINHL